jgi:hypothetical protein
LSDASRSFAEAERAARETLAIPVNPEVTAAQIEYVVTCVERFVRTLGRRVPAEASCDGGQGPRRPYSAISHPAVS